MGKLRHFIKKYFVREKISPVFVPVSEGNLLKDKTALIIGGSGGIGSGIAERFIANGCSVIIAGTNEEKLTSLCKKFGENSKYIVLDATKTDTICEKISEASALFGKIDILVYAAGIHCKNGFGTVTPDDWDSVFNINLKGMYFACQEFSRYLLKNSYNGHILTVSSASCAKAGWTPYEISKAGVRSLTLGFADKLASKGIIVNSIAPGPVATQMLGKSSNDDLSWSGNPTGRMATAEEIGNLAVYMVSDMGNLIVGDTYFISGGSGTVCIDK